MKDSEDFNIRFCRISARMEKCLHIMIIVCTVSLLIGQAVLKNAPSLRHFINKTELLEGTTKAPINLRNE